MIYKDQAELDAGLALWQKRLRLQDWTITVVIVRGVKIPDRQGELNCITKAREAQIRLIHPDDYFHDLEREYDQELVLVHELIHCHLMQMAASVKDYEEEFFNFCHEQATEALAKAFVAAYRKS